MKLSQADKSRLHDLLRQGERTISDLGREFGIDRTTVNYHRVQLGLPPRKDMSVNVVGLFREACALFDAGYSVGTVRVKLGLSGRTADTYQKNWRTGLRKKGLELPPCICGLPNTHKEPCHEKRSHRQKAPIPNDFLETAPTMCRYHLMKHYRTSWLVLLRWIKETGAQPAPRVYKAKPLKAGGRAPRNLRDNLYNEIARLVPMYHAPDVRDEIISELYLAVLDGTIDRDRIAEDGGAIVNRTMNDCNTSLFSKTYSIDEEDEDGFTLAMRIADPESLIPYEDRCYA